MPEASEPALWKRRGEGAEVTLMTQKIAWDAVPAPTTEDTVEAVFIENYETALVLYAQRLSFTAVKQGSPGQRLNQIQANESRSNDAPGSSF